MKALFRKSRFLRVSIVLGLFLGNIGESQAAKYEISLKGAHNKYFVAELGGGAGLNANRPWIGAWEKMHINDLDDGGCIRHEEVVTLSAGNNWYWHPAYLIGGGWFNNKDLKANYHYTGLLREVPSEIQFRIKNLSNNDRCLSNGDQIALQSVKTGKYVVAESNGLAKVDRSAIGSWEKMTVVIHQELDVDPEMNVFEDLLTNHPIISQVVPNALDGFEDILRVVGFEDLLENVLGLAGLDDDLNISISEQMFSTFLDQIAARNLDAITGFHAARDEVPLGNVSIPSQDRVMWTDLHPIIEALVNAWASQPIEETGYYSWENQWKSGYTRRLLTRLTLAELDGATQAPQDVVDAIRWAGERGVLYPTGSTGVVQADWDFTEVVLTTIIWRFQDMLDDDSINALLSLITSEGNQGIGKLGLFGKIDTYGAPVTPFIPETENHILKTEGSRYLKNKWLRQQGNNDPLYDNDSNGMTEFLIGYIDHTIRATLYEYNSVPYTDSTMIALHNLEAFADEPVADKARELLDRIMYKYALGSLEAKRWVPMRRRHEYRGFSYASDHTTSLVRTHMVNAAPEKNYGNWTNTSGGYLTGHNSLPLFAAVLPYRIPKETFDLISSNDKSYFVTMGRGKLTTPELYSAGDGYLISAGGLMPDKRIDYTFCDVIPFGPSCTDATVRETTLSLSTLPISDRRYGFRMSGGNALSTNGASDIVDENTPLNADGSDTEERIYSASYFNNTCVHENFACSAARVWIPTADLLNANQFSMHCEDSLAGVDLSNMSQSPTDKNLNQWCVYTPADNSIYIAIYSSNDLGVLTVMPSSKTSASNASEVLNDVVSNNASTNTLQTKFTWPSSYTKAPNGSISYDRHAHHDYWAITGVDYDQENFDYLGRDYEDWPQINLLAGSTSPSPNTIRIELDNSHLQIHEVEVKIDGEWLYLNNNNITAEISARDHWSVHYAAHKGGDGNPSGNMYHSKTSSGTNWWQAVLSDLPGKIMDIRIRTRGDAYGYRINNARIYLGGNQIGTWVWDGEYTKTFNMNKTVRVELDNSHLQLREVEVQVNGQWHYLNSHSFDAVISARDQWSVHNAAHYAGDGKPTGNMYHSKTSSGTNWWQAVLIGVPGEISNVRIRTREDGYGYRINNARIYVDDTQIATWNWDGGYTKTFQN